MVCVLQLILLISYAICRPLGIADCKLGKMKMIPGILIKALLLLSVSVFFSPLQAQASTETEQPARPPQPNNPWGPWGRRPAGPDPIPPTHFSTTQPRGRSKLV